MNPAVLNELILGATAMASLTAGLFFLRFWRNTRDRFFLGFALAFWVEGINRLMMGLSASPEDGAAMFYLARLAFFALIALAIVDKNLSRSADLRAFWEIEPGR